ncbi:MAG TPA: phosphorylase [Burkholderiales bacterium]|nr:phosphorylase [Burkholderiales bacterium]
MWTVIVERERAALASGALRPIATEESVVEDAGVRFIVRTVSSLAQKAEAGSLATPPTTDRGNPFLPPDPALTVGEISPTHLGVLNKHPVVAHHLLVVTKRFIPQEEALDHDDFAAVATCLGEIDGLAFYNAGREAGASQPHKHLQLVPLPLGAGPWVVPMEVLFDSWAAAGPVLRLLRLPFSHAFALLDPLLFEDPERAAERMLELYDAAMDAIEVVEEGAANDEPKRMAPYNLLVTRGWMLAVPRSRERFDSISVNALGFAGSLFVRDQAEMQRLREAGPMRVLKEVAA